MRAVFDTNVLVSALLSEQSAPARAFFGALSQGEILLSVALVNEINHTLHRKKFDRYLTGEQRETFLIALVQSTTLVEITEDIHVCRDPRDDMLLELALRECFLSLCRRLFVHRFQGKGPLFKGFSVKIRVIRVQKGFKKQSLS